MNQSNTANFLNNLLNASRAGKEELASKKSTFVFELASCLKSLGYLRSVSEKEGEISVVLNADMPISHLKMLSRPGLRRYSSAKLVPRTRTRLGAILLTTPKGILTDVQARKQKTGGELVCEVW